MLNKKDIFYRQLKYGKWIFGYISDNMIARARFYGVLIEHAVIKNLDRKNADNNPIYLVEKDFSYIEDRHGRRYSINFHKNDTIVNDGDCRFWL